MADMPDHDTVVHFDYVHHDNLHQEFEVLRPTSTQPRWSISRGYTSPLSELADRLAPCPTEIAWQNALGLAAGREDLCIILECPADMEDKLRHDEQTYIPDTIAMVNEELKFAASGLIISHERNWKNTCILDMKTYRSEKIKKREGKDWNWTSTQDDLACRAAERVLEIMQPDVILVCQTKTGNSNIQFAKKMSSSVNKAGDIETYTMQSGKQVIVVYSLHPQRACYMKKKTKSTAGYNMLRLNFSQAFNALAGRRITGPGIGKLKREFQELPPLMIEKVIASPSLIQKPAMKEWIEQARAATQVTEQKLNDALSQLVISSV